MTSQQTESVSIARSDAQSIMEASDGAFFNVVFIKKDGSRRSMTARYGVSKGVLGDEASESAKKALVTWRENNPNLLRLFDAHKRAFRTVNLDTIESLRVNGVSYKITKGG